MKISYPTLNEIIAGGNSDPAADNGADGFRNLDIFTPWPLPDPLEPSLTPFLPRFQYDAAYQALKDFYASRPCSTELHQETGLPAWFFGNLREPTGGAIEEISQEFLATNQLMLLGYDDGDARLALVRRSVVTVSEHLQYWQVNAADVPIYGGAITLTYVGRRLTGIANSLYPALPAEIDELAWDPSFPDVLAAMAGADPLDVAFSDHPFWDALLKMIGALDIVAATLEPPIDLRSESSERQWIADRWILPYLVPESRQERQDVDPDRWWTSPEIPLAPVVGKYRPVWRVVIVDKQDRRVMALIDAETYALLHLQATSVGASLQANVYATPTEAVQGTTQLQMLQFDAGVDITQASHVHMSGNRFADPAGPRAFDAHNVDLQLLTATAYYHVRNAQDALANLLQVATIVATTDRPNPLTDVNVSLTAAQNFADARYLWQTNTVVLPRANTGPNPVREPGFDGDVIKHEVAHGVNYYLRGDAFSYENNNNVKQVRTRGLNEGLAFYFACALSGDAQWAEFAYGAGAWPAARRFSGGATAFDNIPADPTGDASYRWGVWWARLLWALRQHPAIGPAAANTVILRAILALSAPITSPDTFAALLRASASSDAVDAAIAAVLRQAGNAV